MKIKITNHETGETISISRDVRISHPHWVHEQMGTSSESELQNSLDQYNATDWIRDGEYLGPDSEGLEMIDDCYEATRK